MKLKVMNADHTLAEKSGTDHLYLVYPPVYKKGDRIVLEVDEPGLYHIRLEDTLLPGDVYIPGNRAEFPIPFGVHRGGYSPRSFTGKRHLITAEKAPAPAGRTVNLAMNPFDGEDVTGMYPHVTSNVTYEPTLRNRLLPNIGLFAARNVIDGIKANESHRLYPYQSWGINMNPEAWLKIDFGREVDLEKIVLCIRCEFPHDTYWKQGTLEFSDGSREVVTIRKTEEDQVYEIKRKGISHVTFKELIKADEPSPWPALTEIEVWGTEH